MLDNSSEDDFYDLHLEPLAALRGRFHSHITVRLASPEQLGDLRAFCREQRIKLTVIDLERATRSQRDVMTTQYHRLRDEDRLEDILAELKGLCQALEARGFEALRVKLEHESLPSLPVLSPENYLEAHIKLRLPEASFPRARKGLEQLASELGFVLSRNPYERREGEVFQFANLRIREGTREQADEKVDAIAAAIDKLGFKVAEVKRECVVLDTLRSHDGWWV